MELERVFSSEVEIGGNRVSSKALERGTFSQYMFQGLA